MQVHSKADVALALPNVGYIAGDNDGIVTVGGVPARREIVLFNMELTPIARYYSLDNGHYLIPNLNPNEQYLIMARDLPPSDGIERYEPAVWDYVTPKDDKTIDEQMELWQSWQT
ncbi:hypothetical protein [Moraxella equi]|uniref:Uncharacterized protein n=1 Tax=Moraxella equi TaxID=60442 RepID=A0A378QTB0_9GAMM|nr:hypothetical protein [Moraxella equi]OPH38417.1 hypothetical protein B5J93_06210 [Moraxella equi]STZ02044.1 Uncharacterised protein [Moraxella equi]STZ03660.1 Uncharacterised protein [Moraxella equi]